MLVFTYVGPRHSAATMKRLREAAEHSMKTDGCVSSASGVTATFAIQWCEAHGVPYTLKSGGDRAYYYVEKGAKT